LINITPRYEKIKAQFGKEYRMMIKELQQNQVLHQMFIQKSKNLSIVPPFIF